MRLSCSVTDFFDADLARATEIAAGAGFDAIELFLSRGALAGGVAGCDPAAVREALAASGIVVSSLNIANLTGATEDACRAEAGELLPHVEFARDLGLSSVNLKGGGRDQPIGALVAGLNALCDALPGGMTVNLGNHHGNRVERISDLRAIVSATPERVRVLVDTGHFLAARVDPVAVAVAFGPRVGLVHLRDQVNGTPVPFGTGKLHFAGLFAALRQAGYDGYCVVELERLAVPQDIIERHRVSREFVLGRLGEGGGGA
jgi:sugar phosphate isomerase/epimerase